MRECIESIGAQQKALNSDYAKRVSTLTQERDRTLNDAVVLVRELDETGKRMPDHACKQCVGLHALDGDFVCAYHRVKEIASWPKN